MSEIPEGCTPADAQMLREENHRLAQESHKRAMLLIEWLDTSLDAQDEEFEPWIESFTARAKEAVSAYLDSLEAQDKQMAAGFGAALAMTEEAVSDANHTTALSFARDTTVYAHAPAAEDVENLKRAYLELREGKDYSELLARFPKEKRVHSSFNDPRTPYFSRQYHCIGIEYANELATTIRNLQAAYTAANEKLARVEEDNRQLRAAIDLRNAREWKLVGELARLRELAGDVKADLEMRAEMGPTVDEGCVELSNSIWLRLCAAAGET